jgi:hypothetical protein
MRIQAVAALIACTRLAAQTPPSQPALVQQLDDLRAAIAGGAWDQASEISTKFRKSVAEARDREGAAGAAKLTTQILDWLPTDTETLVVATQPITLSKHDETRRGTSLQGAQSYVLGLLYGVEGGTLFDSLQGKTVQMAVLAARQFGNHPAEANGALSLGMISFQGCGVYTFAEALPDPLFTRPKNESILSNDVWVSGAPKGEPEDEKFFATRLGADLAVVCNDRSFLEQMLANRGGTKHQRALPETLPEWKYAWRDAPLWGISHLRDGGMLSAISGDVDFGATGITVAFGLPSGVTKARVIAKLDPWTGFMESPELQGAATTRKVQDGVWEISMSDDPKASGMIPFLLMAMLGFVVLV